MQIVSEKNGLHRENQILVRKLENKREKLNHSQEQLEITITLTDKWHQYCQNFLERKSLCNQHIPVKEYAMLNTSTASGALALFKKVNSDNCYHYHLQDFDTNYLAKDKTGIVALKSKNIVLFDKNILKVGYQTITSEKINLSGFPLCKKTFFKGDGIEKLPLDISEVNLSVISNTQIKIENINKKLFVEHLLVKGTKPIKPWHQRASLNTCNKEKDKEQDAIHTENIKTLLKIPMRSDKSIKIVVGEDSLSIFLAYKYEQIKKLTEASNN